MHLTTTGTFLLAVVVGLLNIQSVHNCNVETTERVKAFCDEVRQVAPHLNEKSLQVIAEKCKEGDTQRIMDHLASPIMHENDLPFTVQGTCEHFRRQSAGNYSQEFKDSMKTVLEMCDKKVTAELRIKMYMAYIHLHAVQRNEHVSIDKADIFCKDVSLILSLGIRNELYEILEHLCSKPATVQRTAEIEDYLNNVNYSDLPDTPSSKIAEMCNGILQGEKLKPDLDTSHLHQYTLTIDSNGKQKLLRNLKIGLQELCDMEIKSRATKFKIGIRTTSISVITLQSVPI